MAQQDSGYSSKAEMTRLTDALHVGCDGKSRVQEDSKGRGLNLWPMNCTDDGCRGRSEVRECSNPG